MAPKIFKQTCQINWEQPAQQVHNFVRGLSPYPAAWTVLEDKQFKVFSGRVVENASKMEPGSYTTDGKTFLHVQCGDGTSYTIEELQMEGKKRMKIQDFLRGFTFQHAV